MIFGLWFGVPIAKHLGFFDAMIKVSASADPETDAGTPAENKITKPSPYQELPPQIPRITEPQTLRVFITAYDPYDEICVEQHAHIWPRKTAGGADPETPGVAVDPAVIPYGSTIIIPGIGRLTADDTGGAMRDAARKPIGAFYQLDIRIPAPYDRFRHDPERARAEAHIIAKNISKTLGGHWIDVEVIPPSNP